MTHLELPEKETVDPFRVRDPSFICCWLKPTATQCLPLQGNRNASLCSFMVPTVLHVSNREVLPEGEGWGEGSASHHKLAGQESTPRREPTGLFEAYSRCYPPEHPKMPE